MVKLRNFWNFYQLLSLPAGWPEAEELRALRTSCSQWGWRVSKLSYKHLFVFQIIFGVLNRKESVSGWCRFIYGECESYDRISFAKFYVWDQSQSHSFNWAIIPLLPKHLCFIPTVYSHLTIWLSLAMQKWCYSISAAFQQMLFLTLI